MKQKGHIIQFKIWCITVHLAAKLPVIENYHRLYNCIRIRYFLKKLVPKHYILLFMSFPRYKIKVVCIFCFTYYY